MEKRGLFLGGEECKLSQLLINDVFFFPYLTISSFVLILF